MSDIDDIKSRINIVDLVGKRVALKKAGRNFKGLCPFHNEKTPSFIVSPERESWHCFGCQKGGDIFSFLMEYEHVDFVEALEDLANLAGVTLTRRPTDTPEAKKKQLLYEVNHLASEYYQYILTKHKLGESGRDYLKHRGVSDKSIHTFALGYSTNSWDSLYGFLRKKGYEDRVLVEAGLVSPRSNARAGERGFYDRFRGRVMFTLKDHRGNVVGFAGRLLDPDAKDLPAGRQEPKYVNTQETPVYSKSNVLYALDVTKDAIQKANDAVVVEGELDAISSFQAGIGNVVAIKGSALTDGHVRLLKRFTERITFALDSDMAGDAAARRGIAIAEAAGLDMNVVSLPMGKDPDEAAREDPVLLKKAIKDASPIYDYFIASALKRFDPTSAFGAKKISEELLPIIAKIENTIVQGHYIKKLADALGATQQSVNDGVLKAARGMPLARSESTSPDSAQTALTRPERLELYLLAFLLQGKTVELFEDLQEASLLPEFVHPTVHKIIDHLVTFLGTHSVFLVKDFADSLPPELLPTLDEAFLWDIGELVNDEEQFAHEWMRAIHEFTRMSLRRKIQAISRDVAVHNEDTDSGNLQAHMKELTGRLKELEKSD